MAALVGIPRARDGPAARWPRPGCRTCPSPTPRPPAASGSASCRGADLRVAVERRDRRLRRPAGGRGDDRRRCPAPTATPPRAAFAAGLVDAVLPREAVPAWLDARPARTLTTPRRPPDATSAHAGARRTQSDGVGAGAPQPGPHDRRPRPARSRCSPTRHPFKPGTATHRRRRGSGVLDGRPVVGVALAAEVGGRPTPDGYRLATRAYRLAGPARPAGAVASSTPRAPTPSPRSEARRDRAGDGRGAGRAADLPVADAGPRARRGRVRRRPGRGGGRPGAGHRRTPTSPPIGPEGAAAALRRPREECADRMRITPADLLALGFADALGEPGRPGGAPGAPLPTAGRRAAAPRYRAGRPLCPDRS